jgi:hypothetical protein
MEIGTLLNGIQPSAPRIFEPLPAGTYTAIVSGDKPTTTTVGDTAVIMEYTIIDGEYNNRKIWDFITIGHSDPKWAGVALGNLKALASACGILEPTSTDELQDIPFQLILGVKKKTKGDRIGELEQSVQGYKSLGDIAAKPGRLPTPPAPATVRAPSPAAPAPTGRAAPAPAPWAVKRA